MVEMDREQSFHVLAGQRNETNHVYNTSVPVAVVPVVISDAGDIVQHRQMSLQESDAKEQPSVKRKRGRPRKTRPEEGGGRAQQGQSAHSAPPGDQSTSTNKSRSRAKKTEQVGTTDSTAKSSIDKQGAVEQPGGGGPAKRRRRPRRATTSQTDGDSSAPAKPGSSQTNTVGGTVDYPSTAVCSTVQDAGIASGTPTQVLPTTVVADVTTMDNSPLRRPMTVSIVVPSSAEDVSKLATRTPPPPLSSSSSVVTTSTGDQTPPARVKSFTSRLQGMSTPPLLQAEHPRALNQLPQCVVTTSVVSVSLVDQWNEDGSTAGEASKKDVPKEKQPAAGEEYEEKGGERRNGAKNEVGGEPVRRRKREPVKKPEVHPQEQTPVKRKRGRPSKIKDSPHPVSDKLPSTTREAPRKEHVSSGDQLEGKAKPDQQSIESITQATEMVVKRKRGRPPKSKSQDTATESQSLPLSSRQPDKPVADPTSLVSSEEGDKENIAKRGRTAKSCTKTPEATRQLPVKRKRGRPRKYPIPVVAASGPFLPSVSGITLPNDESEDTPSVGGTPSKTNGQEVSIESAALKSGKSKRGGPPKKPEDEEEGPPVKRRPGRPRKNPLPAEKEESTPPKRPQKQASPKQPQKQASPKQLQKKEEELEQQVRRKPGRPRKRPLKSSPEVIQKKIKSPVTEIEKKTVSDPLPKRKRGRPKKIQPTALTLQDPGLSSADESSVSANVADKSEDDSSEVEKMTLQISFSDSDSEHSEKLEVQTSTIMALADRVAPTPSPPRQVDSPLLDPSFEESYDEDSDPEAK